METALPLLLPLGLAPAIPFKVGFILLALNSQDKMKCRALIIVLNSICSAAIETR